ncbi:MAG TPA: hypothetical protein VE983_01470 [Solirubrobacteraceae bacterium]|nr:hypothetical protein [Solirubrobacteraceae bacterium]
MRARNFLLAAVGVVCSTLVIAGAAWAAGASTTITINGPDHVYGTIHSSSKTCLGGRTVVVYMQKGTSRNPAVDQKMDSTTSTRQGNQGLWDMGNPGFPKHKNYYAKAKAKTGCKAGYSATVRF